MMNNAFVIDQAKRFAGRLRKEAGSEARSQVDLAYRLALSRPPTDQEVAAAIPFIRQDDNALADFAQALFNLNEFVYAP